MFSGLAIVFVAENDYRFVRKFGRGICNRKVLAGGHCANNGWGDAQDYLDELANCFHRGWCNVGGDDKVAPSRSYI